MIRKAERSNTLPTSFRRGDIAIKEEDLKDLKERQEVLKGRTRRGSIVFSVAEETDMAKFLCQGMNGLMLIIRIRIIPVEVGSSPQRRRIAGSFRRRVHRRCSGPGPTLAPIIVLVSQSSSRFWETATSLDLHMHGKLSPVVQDNLPGAEREAVLYRLKDPALLKDKYKFIYSCVKGAKGYNDTTPNQDNFSYTVGFHPVIRGQSHSSRFSEVFQAWDIIIVGGAWK